MTRILKKPIDVTKEEFTAKLVEFLSEQALPHTTIVVDHFTLAVVINLTNYDGENMMAIEHTARSFGLQHVRVDFMDPSTGTRYCVHTLFYAS